MQTIVITGPESSGKTTLARQLAEHFDATWVPEFARGYLENLSRSYTYGDLLEIAKGQVATEMEFAEQEKKLLLLDTSLEVLKIWSQYRFDKCDPWILKKMQQRKHDLYLLCQPDLPWEPDPQRENPNDREELFKLYRAELIALNVNFVEIGGAGKARLETALHTISYFQKLTTDNR